MPIQINKPVTVYRLDDNTDLRECFTVLAAAGWLCNLSADGDPVVWSVLLQHNKKRQQVSASTDDVVVWDGATPIVQTLADYNAENPGNRIVKGKN